MSDTINFNNKWIENAVRDCLQKKDGEITSEDMEKIKYLKIGEGFDNTFIIEMSTVCPPKPFKDQYGGDEWEEYCLSPNDIPRYIDTYKEESDFQFSMYDFEHDEYSGYYDEDENSGLSLKEQYLLEKEKKKIWKDFESSVCKSHYYEKIEDENEWEKWYAETNNTFWQDIKYFTNIEVLRLYGGKAKDLTFLNELNCLCVMEITETRFEGADGIENFEKLQQLCCWMN